MTYPCDECGQAMVQVSDTHWTCVNLSCVAYYEHRRIERSDGISAGRAARDAAMQRVEDHADPEWKDEALQAVLLVARVQEYLTSDDLWEHLMHPREPRALGPVMMEAKRYGWILPTGEYRPCRTASRHVAPVRVWRSLIRKKD